MGLIVLHSAHLSKIFRRLMGTRCNLRWREADDRELVWTVAPQHPIAAGVPHPIVIPKHEMYGEYFDIPPPDELVFVSSFTGGEVFRSGCCFRRGKGRVFYFSPGHETYPIYHDPVIAARAVQRGGLGGADAVGDRHAHVAEFADRVVRNQNMNPPSSNPITGRLWRPRRLSRRRPLWPTTAPWNEVHQCVAQREQGGEHQWIHARLPIDRQHGGDHDQRGGGAVAVE